MVVIIIKWSVMTTDNPHVHPGSTARQLFVNAPLQPKTHADVCGTRPQKLKLKALPLFERGLNFYRLAYGNLFFSLSLSLSAAAQGPHIKFICFARPQLHSVKGQTVLVW